MSFSHHKLNCLWGGEHLCDWTRGSPFSSSCSDCILFLFSLKMSALSAASVSAAPVTESAEQKKPLKPCCACPETKKVRDACIIEKGEENCTQLIEAHKDCMRALGFKI
uniref:Cytochrome c oxidase copper chaperone n=2 Tax=Echeneis naucrates TaxID=173247 RepID=A0A665URV9_ECHNA